MITTHSCLHNPAENMVSQDTLYKRMRAKRLTLTPTFQVDFKPSSMFSTLLRCARSVAFVVVVLLRFCPTNMLTTKHTLVLLATWFLKFYVQKGTEDGTGSGDPILTN